MQVGGDQPVLRSESARPSVLSVARKSPRSGGEETDHDHGDQPGPGRIPPALRAPLM